MPQKGKKGGKKKKKNEATTKKILSSIVSYWKRYESHCNKMSTCIAPSLKSIMNKCKEDESYMTKFIIEPKPVQTRDDPIVKLEPIMNAIRDERYTNIKSLYVWSLTLTYLDAVAVVCFSTVNIFLQKIKLKNLFISLTGTSFRENNISY